MCLILLKCNVILVSPTKSTKSSTMAIILSDLLTTVLSDGGTRIVSILRTFTLFLDLSELTELATEFFELHNCGKPEESSQPVAIRFTNNNVSCK